MAGSSNGKAKALRFGALIRVSTEKQEKQGESLRTQKAETTDDVAQLNGKIAKWYGGQEHATPGHETAEVDRLLVDAANGKFDAVIVAHQDRWSRDNAKSKAGLEVLRTNRVRFFVRTQEYDLFNPTHKFFLGVSAEIGELTAGTQNEKSIKNRIARSKRGIPTSGKKPFGRVFNKVTEKWEIVPDKQAMIKDIAKRYLAGESAPLLAKEYGMNNSNLMKTLRSRCGDTWVETFDHPTFNIHEIATHTIPRLLPEKTIEAIRKRAKSNRKFSGRNLVNQETFLLREFLFCSHCGYLLTGTLNHKGTASEKLYYRHCHNERVKPCPTPKMYVDGKKIENEVLFHLFNAFGNPKAVERAIQAAIPNQGEVAALRTQQGQVKLTLEKITARRSRLIDAITEGTIMKEQARAKSEELESQETQQQEKLTKLDDQLGHLPSSELVHSVSADIVEQMQKSFFPAPRGFRPMPGLAHSNGKKKVEGVDMTLLMEVHDLDSPEDEYAAIEAMTWADKRALVEAVFRGNAPDGSPAGVYVEFVQVDDGKKLFKFEIRGIIWPEWIPAVKSHRTSKAAKSSSKKRRRDCASR